MVDNNSNRNDVTFYLKKNNDNLQVGLGYTTIYHPFLVKKYSPAPCPPTWQQMAQHWSDQGRAKIGPCVEHGLGISLLWMKYIIKDAFSL